jgi:hypothetical protein
MALDCLQKMLSLNCSSILVRCIFLNDLTVGLFVGMSVTLVGLVKVERLESLERPQNRMTTTFLARFNEFIKRADSDEEQELCEHRADFEFSIGTSLFSDETKREKELIGRLYSGSIVPMCVFGREDGTPPSETEYAKDTARVQEFSEMLAARSGKS